MRGGRPQLLRGIRMSRRTDLGLLPPSSIQSLRVSGSVSMSPVLSATMAVKFADDPSWTIEHAWNRRHLPWLQRRWAVLSALGDLGPLDVQVRTVLEASGMRPLETRGGSFPWLGRHAGESFASSASSGHCTVDDWPISLVIRLCLMALPRRRSPRDLVKFSLTARPDRD